MIYEITSEFIEYNGIELFRIQLKEDCIWGYKGDKGGWIQNSNNLFGNAWVSGDAMIFENAQVWGNARISGNAKIYGDAQVLGNAHIYDNAEVFGNTIVLANSKVFGNASVSENVIIDSNSKVYGNAEVYGDSILFDDSCVFGNAKVFGSSLICENAWVSGSVELLDGFACSNQIINNEKKASEISNRSGLMGNFQFPLMIADYNNIKICFPNHYILQFGNQEKAFEQWEQEFNTKELKELNLSSDNIKVILVYIKYGRRLFSL